MEKIVEVGKFLIENWGIMLAGLIAFLVALVGLLKAFIALMKIFPGEQGETFAQKIVDALQKVIDFIGGAPKALK